MEESMARHWGREKVYVQAFRISSQKKKDKAQGASYLLTYIVEW